MLTQAWGTVRKRPWWPIAGTLLGLFAGLFSAHREVNVYQASARIIISRATVGKLRLTSTDEVGAPAAIGNQMLEMKSDAVLNQVIRDLNLVNDPAVPVTRNADHGDSSYRRAWLRELKLGVSVRLIPTTSIVVVSFSSRDPRFSASVVNTLVNDVIRQSYEQSFERSRRASVWPANQLAQLKQQIQQTQTRMIEVQRRAGNTGFASEYSRAEKPLDALTRNVADATTARDQAEAQFRRLLALPPDAQAEALDALAGTSSDPGGGQPSGSQQSGNQGLVELERRSHLHEAEAALAALAATLGPEHPQLRALRAEVDALEQGLERLRQSRLQQLRAEFQTAANTQRQTRAALDAAVARTNRLADDTVEYRELLREFTFTRALYTGLYTRLRNASVQAGLGTLPVQVLDPAQVPLEPLPRSSWRLVLETTLAGLLAGCFIALALQNLRPGLSNVTEVEAVTDLPSLAALPRLKLGSLEELGTMSIARRNLMAIEQPTSVFTESLRVLRTNLELSGPGDEPKYILFTSATPSEGKTTVAGNYAVVLAEGGQRVLLIDADMHRPNLHHRFGLSGRRGLSNVLAGGCSWREAVQPIAEVPNLDVLVAGPVPPAPAALLAGPSMLRLLRQVGPVYSHIVLDSPPVMAVGDGVMLSQLVDAVVFVVRQHKIGKHLVRLGRDRLARSGAPLAGVVLNGLSPEDDHRF